MRSIDFTGQFKKDLKKAIKRNLPEELLFEVVKSWLMMLNCLQNIMITL